MQKIQRSGFIPEIQGLRTVALLMVATFHVWFDNVSGGVDIFLLVSAYLLTRSLTRKSESGERTRPVTYLVRKFSRLLPAAAGTIVLILIAVFWLLPMVFWQGALSDALNSLLYVENFRLQAAEVNYFTVDHSAASPFQHFWSLSVQGQVFVLFAFLHLLGDLVARALNQPVRRVLLGMFILVGLGSFIYSIWLTDRAQAFAYFDTGARIWEFAAGSILALIHPWLRLSEAFRSFASWVGLLAMLACGFVLPVESSFPGWAALWPVVAAALVIVSAGTPTRFGADRLLATQALGNIGGYTYALYLIHWPVLVLFLWLTGASQANWWQGIVILAISGILSFLIARLIERPVASWSNRRRPKRSRHQPRSTLRGLAVVGTGISVTVGLIAAGSIVFTHLTGREQAAAEVSPDMDLRDNASASESNESDLIPAEHLVTMNWTPTGADCLEGDPFVTATCYEIRAAGDSEKRTVFSLGSSHTAQFNGVLLEAVNRNPSWTFRSQFSADCYYTTREDVGEACVALWDQGAAYITSERPDLVVLHGTQTHLEFELTQPDLIPWIEQAMVASPESQFVILRDNPRNPQSPFECAVQFGYESDNCSFPYSTATDPEYIAAVEATGAIWVDLNEYICPGEVCRPSLAGVVTYLDDNHLTYTFSRTLAQKFTDQITGRVAWWPTNVYEEGVFVDRTTSGNLVADLNQG